MKKIPLFLLALLLIVGCVSQKFASGSQGLKGEVRWVEGNLMPMIGDTTYARRAQGIPIQREILVYKPTKVDDLVRLNGSFYSSITTDLVAKVKSGKDGKFMVSLPVGKYSIFVSEEGKLFANVFDGENHINPVTIHADKYADLKILVNYKAFY